MPAHAVLRTAVSGHDVLLGNRPSIAFHARGRHRARMKRRTNRILTTHVGSLIRPQPLQEFLRARQGGKPYDDKAYQTCLTASVTDVVREQAGAGIDVVSDGEFGKSKIGRASCREGWSMLEVSG